MLKRGNASHTLSHFISPIAQAQSKKSWFANWLDPASTAGRWSHRYECKLAASTSSGRAGAVGMLQAILQVMLQGAGPVGYCLKVLKGVDICWVLCLLLDGRFVPGSSFLGIMLAAWLGVLVPGRSWFLAFVGSWALRVLGALGALGSLGSRRPLRGSDCLASWLVCELWLGVLRVFRGRVCAGGWGYTFKRAWRRG